MLAGIAWVLPTNDDGVSRETAQAVSPEFEVRVRRSSLLISGHAASTQHEDRLRQVVSDTYPTLEHRFDFRPLGIVPDWWNEATADLVAALATMTSPSARLDENSLHVRAVIARNSDVAAPLDALDLPHAVDVSTELEKVTADLSPDALCERQFDRFATTPIRFEESTTILRTSAYPALDRVAAFADACREASITITGHTDASGSPDWNQALSLRRAEAVAAYLEERGIDAARMITEGAGSTAPVADNATRYGRSINRRIEIVFSGAD
jgi:OOP family OmpA-OmpF porin